MAKPRKGYSFGISPQCISASACNECQGCRFELARETIPSFPRPKRSSQCTVVESTATISLGFGRAKNENTAKVNVLVGHWGDGWKLWAASARYRRCAWMPLATFWVFLCIVLGIALAQILPVAKRMHAKFAEITQQLRRRVFTAGCASSALGCSAAAGCSPNSGGPAMVRLYIANVLNPPSVPAPPPWVRA